MKRIILALISSVALSVCAQAEDCVGYFAIQHKNFPVKTAKYAGQHFTCLGYLHSTFGNSNKAIKAFMKGVRGKPHKIIARISNEVCRRYNGCQKGDFQRKLSVQEYNNKLASNNTKTRKQVKKRIKRIKKYWQRYGDEYTDLYISLGLESQFSKEAVKTLIQIALEAGIDESNIIHNPVHMAPYHGKAGFSGIVSEYHVMQPSPGETGYIVSHDGFRPGYCGDEAGSITGNYLSDQYVQSWANKNRNAAVANEIWCGKWQGLSTGDSNSGSLPKPRDRVITASTGVLDRYRQLTGMGGSQPPQQGNHHKKGCSKIKAWGKGDVLKQSDHGGTVFVSRKKYKRVLLVEPNGKKYKMEYTGADNPINGKDRHHYRRPEDWNQFKDNSVIKAKIKRKLLNKKTHCFLAGQAGQRHG